MQRKPAWLKTKIITEKSFSNVKKTLKKYNLHTICDGARCPNKGECWSLGTATFMILGDTCTRNCSFCAVPTGAGGPLDEKEPENLAQLLFQVFDPLQMIDEPLRQSAQPDVHDGKYELFLAAVVVVDRTETDAGPFGHIPDVGFVKIGAGENFQHRRLQAGVSFGFKSVEHCYHWVKSML